MEPIGPIEILTDLELPPPPEDISDTSPEAVSRSEEQELLLEELPPVEPPAPELTSGLPPLEMFDVKPELAEGVVGTPMQKVRYKVDLEGFGTTGADGPFKELSALLNSSKKEATPAQILSRARADESLLSRILRSEGWYDAEVDSIVTPPETEGEQTHVLFTVEPGERYTWNGITLDLIPDDAPELAEDFGLKEGSPVVAEEVEVAEGALLFKLQQSGYPFAEIGVRDVVLSASEPTASYFLTGNTGPKGVFGKITMGRRYRPFDEKHAAVIARFKPGDPYDALLVDDLRRALIDTQLFGGVTVSVKDSEKRDADGNAIADVQIMGNRGPQRLTTGQLGYSSGEGARLEALWRHRNFIKPEGQFTARGVVGTIEQLASAELAMSNWHKRDRTLRFLGEIANTNRPAFHARTATLSASLSRTSTMIWQKPISWSLGAELLATHERDRSNPLDDGRHVFLIASLPTMIMWDQSDDLLDPTKGFRLSLWATPEFSRQGNGNFTSYGRVQAEATGYQRFGDSFVLAGRLHAGSLLGADRISIAPTRRLYAGGGGSVRGFAYQGVGPRNANGRPTGGRGLLEGSIEGRYRMGDLGVVAFVDAGTLTERTRPTLHDIHIGAGVGVRYYTNFGPIRVDVARAVAKTAHAPKIGMYISIGQAF